MGIDLTKMDETAKQLFMESETYYYKGLFLKALDTLMRCIRAPKSETYRILNVKSCNMLGLIYSCVGQETLSKENLIKALALGREYGETESMIQSYMNLGFLHQKLGDLETALEYEKQALELLSEYEEENSTFHAICLACCGIIQSKLGNNEESIRCLRQSEVLLPVVQDLNLRICYQKGDKQAFQKGLEMLKSLKIPETDFLRYVEVYFDVCAFFWEKELQEELKGLLDYMKQYLRDLPLAYLKYRICNYELLYMQNNGTQEAQWEAMQNWFAVLPEYEAEQQKAKMYSFDYIEYLHEEKNLSDKMERKSKLDPMTGLLNKFTLEFLAEEYFKQKKKEEVAAVLLIDMDHFKQVNDTLGHLAGDAILVDTAAEIQKFFKKDMLCGRVGGDEFVIFVKDVRDISALRIQAEFLRQEIAKTTSERSITIAIHASIGIALSTAGYKDYASLFAAADKALYRAKKGGRNKIEIIE